MVSCGGVKGAEVLEVVPDSEIVEYEWTDLDHCYDDVRQAPLLCDRVIPALQQQGLL